MLIFSPMFDILFFIFIGAIAGLLSGMFGIGGGIIMVPGMLEWIHVHNFETSHAMQISVGTALSGITVISLISGLSHRKVGVIRWDLVATLVPGTVVGACFGVYIADSVPSQLLRHVFAFVLLATSLQIIFFEKPTNLQAPIIKRGVMAFCGLFIGIVSGLIGLGGGLMIVPLLLLNGLPLVQCASTAIWCTLPTVAIATLTAMYTGFNEPDLLPHCLGYVYYPATLFMCGAALLVAPFGVKLAHRLPRKILKTALVSVIGLIFLRLMIL